MSQVSIRLTKDGSRFGNAGDVLRVTTRDALQLFRSGMAETYESQPVVKHNEPVVTAAEPIVETKESKAPAKRKKPKTSKTENG